LLAATRAKVAEILDGVLYLQPTPAKPHAAAISALGEELGPPFKRRRGGPGGWILVDEPEIYLVADVFVPDLAGWRLERMPFMTNELPYFEIAPDWACEVLSDSTRKQDRIVKVQKYAHESINHVWLVDPIARTLAVLRLAVAQYRIASQHADAECVRAEPFDAIEPDLSVLWADVVLEP
jgi:Uma2 family endonuclease